MTIEDANNIETIRAAADRIKRGEIIGMPTETVYGLAGDATNDEAVAKIFAAKGRPNFNPLIVHVTGIEMVKRFARVDKLTEKLMNTFWPGPLTLVIPITDNDFISDRVTAGLKTVAVRAPAHPIASSILTLADIPVAAPSANKSGQISPTTAQHVADGLRDGVELIVDGGACKVGIESTILGVQGEEVTLLRAGIITKEQVRSATGIDVRENKTANITSPGQLLKHYAPNKKMRLSAFRAEKNEVLIGFGAIDGAFNLSPSGNLEEAAANLFAMLRDADKHEAEVIAVAPIPFEGCGYAINDRLSRAAERDPQNAKR